MPRALVIGLAAGLASALVFASASAGGMSGRVILFFLAPLPCYLAALGWGTAAAVASALVSAVGTGIFLGPSSGLILLVSQGMPLVMLCHLALLARPAGGQTTGGPAPSSQSSASLPSLEWYPLGRILAAATLIAGTFACVTLLLLAGDIEQFRHVLHDLVSKVLVGLLPQLGKGAAGEADIAALTEILLYALPAGWAVLWLGDLMLNLWLGGRITLISGRLPRPWPDLRLIRFPRGFGLGLLASLIATQLPGLSGLFGAAFSGAFLFAYLLMGLAIIHYATQGVAARPFILWGVYLSLVVLNPWSGLVVAMIAILEPVLPWKRPLTGAPPAPRPTT